VVTAHSPGATKQSLITNFTGLNNGFSHFASSSLKALLERLLLCGLVDCAFLQILAAKLLPGATP
jgi:hypothetical protein